MKIALLTGPKEFQFQEEQIPALRPDEVLVQVAACGVCTSELDMWEGKAGGDMYPRYPGHEVSGVVANMGKDVQGLAPGDRVAVWAPGRGFAEYVVVKSKYCFPAGDLPLDLALAEPLACAVNTVELANVSLGDDVVIIGAGFMGNLVQKLVAMQGPRHLIVADTRADALDRALRLGATHVINVSKESLPEAVKYLTDQQGADVTFEVVGAQAPLNLVGDVTRMSGKAVIVGFHQGQPRQIPLGYWNWMAFQILNAHFREEATILRGMRIGMRLLTSGRLSLEDLVTHRFQLSEIGQAFRTAHEKPEGFVKSTVVMQN
ncbi:MAG TPA: alcohol dehydrogenase catalytic domain-containing protein, partial [Anaerolineales bacterium]|nr:alcohol dehydrogenase catalytic domain-containing protein [Anaerolineales bacterium]